MLLSPNATNCVNPAALVSPGMPRKVRASQATVRPCCFQRQLFLATLSPFPQFREPFPVGRADLPISPPHEVDAIGVDPECLGKNSLFPRTSGLFRSEANDSGNMDIGWLTELVRLASTVHHGRPSAILPSGITLPQIRRKNAGGSIPDKHQYASAKIRN